MLFSAASPATAQDKPTEIKIIVEAVTPEGQLCGLSKPAHVASLQTALRRNGIPETRADFAGPIAWIQTQTIIVNRTCFTSINLQIQDYTSMEVKGMGRLFGTVTFCGRDAVVGGSQMATRVDANIQNMFDRCLAEMTGQRLE